MSQEQQQPNSHLDAQANTAPASAPSPVLPKSGLGIAGFVLAIVAAVTSFIPIVNNLSALLAVIGLVFSIIGLVSGAKGKRSGKGLSIAAVVINVVAFAVVLATQSFYSAAIDSATSASSASSSASTEESQPAANAKADASASDASANYDVTIEGMRLATDYNGEPAAIVTFTWTNNTDKGIAFAAAFSAKAFQNDVQLDSAIINSSKTPDYESGTTLKEVKPQGTQTVQVAYALADDSPVTVECSELFASKKAPLATMTFDVA